MGLSEAPSWEPGFAGLRDQREVTDEHIECGARCVRL
jgi:hypothetical protein